LRVTPLVVIEQLGAVDVQRLGRRVGRLTMEELWSLDEAVATYLGLRLA
jgi:mRNA-degrading endonuclease toxin of MazEF toxin-antitoxin module